MSAGPHEKTGVKSRLENRACDQGILRKILGTNQARFGSGVSGHSREFLALCNPFLADRRRIQK